MDNEVTRSLAIAGEAGSGKTSIALALARELTWGYFGAGEYFRSWCKDQGILDIGAANGQDEIHNHIDNALVGELRSGLVVVEGRVAGLVAAVNSLPGVIKVLLVCEAEERYRRIYYRDTSKFPEGLSQAREITIAREGQNRSVFAGRYGGRSYMEHSIYDLVVDNGVNTLQQSVDEIMDALASKNG